MKYTKFDLHIDLKGFNKKEEDFAASLEKAMKIIYDNSNKVHMPDSLYISSDTFEKVAKQFKSEKEMCQSLLHDLMYSVKYLYVTYTNTYTQNFTLKYKVLKTKLKLIKTCII